MKKLVISAALALLCQSAALAASPDPQLMAPIKAFLDSVCKGDIAGEVATTTPAGQLILDDLPPFRWSGPHAMKRWGEALVAFTKQDGITDVEAILGDVTNSIVDGKQAYIVANIAFTFKEKGTPMREPGQIVVTEEKTPTGWLISGFSLGMVDEPPAK